MIFSKYDGNIYIFDSIDEVLDFMRVNDLSILDCSLHSPEDNYFSIVLN